MHTRPLRYLIVILMGCSVYGTVVAEDLSSDDSTITELNAGDTQINEQDNDKKLPEGIISTEVVKKKSTSTIKMIVGGQSTDGLAKQVTLPVKD